MPQPIRGDMLGSSTTAPRRGDMTPQSALMPQEQIARWPFRLLALLVAIGGAFAAAALLGEIYQHGFSWASLLKSLALLFVAWFFLPMAWIALTGKLRRGWPGFGHAGNTDVDTGQKLFDAETRLVGKDGFTIPNSEFGIEILNDDATPMDFVVEQLVAHLGLARQQAVEAMLRIHVHGGALFPMLSEADAVSASERISLAALQHRHPLICRFADFRRLDGDAGAT
jgi:ATP-dependent Clp protease adaptor protein ClpS